MKSHHKKLLASAAALITSAVAPFRPSRSRARQEREKNASVSGPRDVHGNALAIGDEVVLRGKITSILIHKNWPGISRGGGVYCHFEIQPINPPSIGAWPHGRFSGMTGDQLELTKRADPEQPRSGCDLSPAQSVEWDNTVSNPKWSAAGCGY